MTHEEYVQAADYWIDQEAAAVKMERSALLERIEADIRSHNTCALATAAGGFVRCTPIEYNYWDGAFWLFTEGGRKFAALEQNEEVCLAIFEPYKGFGDLLGIQISGRAEVINPSSEEYGAAAAKKKLNLDTLKRLGHPMHLIKVIPFEIDYLNSDLKKQGYSIRQRVTMDLP